MAAQDLLAVTDKAEMGRRIRIIRHTDPETWRQMMNHSDLGQLPRYVHTDDGRKRDALKGQ